MSCCPPKSVRTLPEYLVLERPEVPSLELLELEYESSIPFLNEDVMAELIDTIQDLETLNQVDEYIASLLAEYLDHPEIEPIVDYLQTLAYTLIQALKALSLYQGSKLAYGLKTQRRNALVLMRRDLLQHAQLETLCQ